MATLLKALATGSAFLVGMTIAPSGAPAQAAPLSRSYRMECRGGGEMSANYYPGETVRLEIHFSKAPTAARATPPGLGECTWVDRPINAEEPYWLAWRFPQKERRIGRIMFGSASGSAGVHLQPNPDSEYVSALIMEVSDPQLRQLIDAIHRGYPFAVQCYNDGTEMFFVTGLLI